MKRNFILCSTVLFLLLLVGIGSAYYLRKESTNTHYEVVTLLGDDSMLDGLSFHTTISSQTDYIKSNYWNYRTEFNEQAHTTQQYFYELTNTNDDNYCLLSFGTDYRKSLPHSNYTENETLRLRDYFSVFPIYIQTNSTKLPDALNLIGTYPYIKINVPDNLYYTPYNAEESYLGTTDNFYDNFSLGSSFVNIGDRYFYTHVTSDLKNSQIYSSSSNLSYEITNGIFEAFTNVDKKSNKLEDYILPRYSFTETEVSSISTLDIVALEELNCIGLLVNENSNLKLIVYDITQNKVVSTWHLSTLPTNATIWFASITNTNNQLCLKVTFEQYEGQQTYYSVFSYGKSLDCTEEITISYEDLSAAFTPLISSFSNFEITSSYYKENTTYFSGIVYSNMDSKNDWEPYPVPILFAMKDNTLIYLSYIDTSVSEDYNFGNLLDHGDYPIERYYDYNELSPTDT